MQGLLKNLPLKPGMEVALISPHPIVGGGDQWAYPTLGIRARVGTYKLSVYGIPRDLHHTVHGTWELPEIEEAVLEDLI